MSFLAGVDIEPHYGQSPVTLLIATLIFFQRVICFVAVFIIEFSEGKHSVINL